MKEGLPQEVLIHILVSLQRRAAGLVCEGMPADTRLSTEAVTPSHSRGEPITVLATSSTPASLGAVICHAIFKVS